MNKQLPEILLIWPGAKRIDENLLQDLSEKGLSFIEYRPQEGESRQKIIKNLNILKKTIPTVIINNHVDLLEFSDGVWVGENDTPLPELKKNPHFKKFKIVGKTVKTEKQLSFALAHKADAIGVGSVFRSSTKKEAIMTDWAIIEKIIKKSKIPAYLVGGINVKNLKLFLKKYPLKGFRIAVSSGILETEDPGESFLNLKKLITKFQKTNRIHRL